MVETTENKLLGLSFNGLAIAQIMWHQLETRRPDKRERMIKFDRSSVEEILSPGDPVLLTITGRLYDGTGFECSDEIRVIG